MYIDKDLKLIIRGVLPMLTGISILVIWFEIIFQNLDSWRAPTSVLKQLNIFYIAFADTKYYFTQTKKSL